MQSTDDFQTQVLQRLDELKTDVEQRFTKLETDLREANVKFDAYVKASDRLLGVATTIIITAGTVTILSPFVQSVAPALRALVDRAAG